MVQTDAVQTILQAAAGVAFPAAIAVFLLVRMETAVNRLRDQIGDLTRAVDRAFEAVREQEAKK